MNLSKKQRRIFEICKKTSRLSNAEQFRFGVIICRRRHIMGIGTNNIHKTHTDSKTRGNYHHAEFSAIINARTDLTGTDIYIWRSGRNDSPLLAKPCWHCMDLIKKVGIRKVYYTTGETSKEFAVEEVN